MAQAQGWCTECMGARRAPYAAAPGDTRRRGHPRDDDDVTLLGGWVQCRAERKAKAKEPRPANGGRKWRIDARMGIQSAPTYVHHCMVAQPRRWQ